MAAPAFADHGRLESHERRVFRRHESRQRQVFLKRVVEPVEAFDAVVQNYSEGGVRLSAAQAVPAGTLLNIRPSNAPAFAPWLRVQVVYCFADLNRWVLGCQFVRLPTSEELVLFA